MVNGFDFDHWIVLIDALLFKFLNCKSGFSNVDEYSWMLPSSRPTRKNGWPKGHISMHVAPPMQSKQMIISLKSIMIKLIFDKENR